MPPPDPEAMAAAIADAGRTRAYGIPGSGPSLSLIDALERRGVPFTTTAFEGSAAVMAGAAGRLSGRAGLCVTIKGPGVANSVAGLAVCAFEAWPVVAVAEAYEPDAPAWRLHKRMDHGALTAAVCKGRWAGDYAAAAARAQAERPGPVGLDLIGAASPIADLDPAPPPDLAGPEAVAAAGRRPLVIAGTWAIRAGLSDALNALDLPVLTTAAAKGVVDETLPHAMGVYTGAGGPRAAEGALLSEADAVIGVGLVREELLGRPPGHVAAGAAGLEALRGVRWRPERAPDARRDLLGRAFGPAHVFDAVERRFGAGGVRTVLDTGWFCTVGEHVIRAPRAGLHLSSGAGRSMGAGLPTALGAAFHDPGVPTVAYLGDGGAPMFLAEARLAVEARLPVLVVVLTDGGFGSILTGALATGRTRRPLTFPGRSWAGALSGMGLPGTRAESLAAVEAALAAWDPGAGPAWLEVPFGEAEYQAMVAGLR